MLNSFSICTYMFTSAVVLKLNNTRIIAFLRIFKNIFLLSKLIVKPWFRIQIGSKSWSRNQSQCIWILVTDVY